MPVSTSSGLSSRRSDRLGWVDVTRGALILLVIFYHVTTVHVPSIAGSDGQRLMLDVSTFLRPIRMPLFFAVSGFLAVGAVNRSWPSLLRGKTAFFYWIYAVWLVIQTLMPMILSVTEAMASESSRDLAGITGATLLDLLQSASFAPSNLWFLYALALYFPLAKLLRRAGAWTLLPAFAVYLVSVDGWGIDVGQLPAVAAYFVFFFAGTMARPVFNAFSSSPRPLVTVAAILLFIGLFAVEVVVPTGSTILLALSSILAIRIGITAAAFVAARLRVLAAILSALGARTLPVYVLQMPLVWTWDKIVVRAFPDFRIESPVLLMVYVLVLTAVVAATAVGIHAALRRPFPLLFTVPWRTTTEPTRTAAHRAPKRQALPVE